MSSSQKEQAGHQLSCCLVSLHDLCYVVAEGPVTFRPSVACRVHCSGARGAKASGNRLD